MREIKQGQTKLGEVDIAEIKFDLRSRDEIPKLLMGLQYIYCTEEYRKRVFEILNKMLPSRIDAKKGRPGMEYWKILVLGTIRLNCNWDFDKVKEMADNHLTIRQMLGHGIEDEETKYPLQTIIDNVSLFTPEILNKINNVVVEAGHNLIKKKEELNVRCDSFVVETDVHYPTDINLLWDAMRKVIILTGRLCEQESITGWRQDNHLLKKTKRLYRIAQKSTNSYRMCKKRKENKEKEMKEAYKEYVSHCKKLLERAKATIEKITELGIRSIAITYSIRKYIAHGERQIDQIIQRVLDGEAIPHQDKVFSIFEEYTEWLSKGKAGVMQELGLNVCVVEDQYKYILNHKVMEKIVDKDVAVPVAEETLKIFSDIKRISFDKNFWSPSNKVKLEGMIDEVILPKKGRISEEEREKMNQEEYVHYRRKHAAVESGINALENHGLDRCCDCGIKGFKRYVALAVAARNLQNLGNTIQQNRIKNRKKQEKLKLKKSA
jgi:IS5 family transposase